MELPKWKSEYAPAPDPLSDNLNVLIRLHRAARADNPGPGSLLLLSPEAIRWVKAYDRPDRYPEGRALVACAAGPDTKNLHIVAESVEEIDRVLDELGVIA